MFVHALYDAMRALRQVRLTLSIPFYGGPCQLRWVYKPTTIYKPTTRGITPACDAGDASTSWGNCYTASVAAFDFMCSSGRKCAGPHVRKCLLRGQSGRSSMHPALQKGRDCPPRL